MKTGKNDHPGYSCERTQWVLVTGVGPLNFIEAASTRHAVTTSGTMIAYRGRYVNKQKAKI